MDWNIYLLIQKPTYQALLFLVLTTILIFILQPKSADAAWVIAGNTFAVFLVVNAALQWVATSPWRYFFYSIGSGVGYLLVIAIIMSALYKILHLKGSGESSMYFLILIYQPFALLLVMLVKWMVTKWF